VEELHSAETQSGIDFNCGSVVKCTTCWCSVTDKLQAIYWVGLFLLSIHLRANTYSMIYTCVSMIINKKYTVDTELQLHSSLRIVCHLIANIIIEQEK
jgi:hypothetical protein